MEVGGQRHTPAALPPRKARYPLYRRLGGPQGRSGRVRINFAPTGIRTPDRLARSESLYRLSYRGPRTPWGYKKFPCSDRNCLFVQSGRNYFLVQFVRLSLYLLSYATNRRLIKVVLVFLCLRELFRNHISIIILSDPYSSYSGPGSSVGIATELRAGRSGDRIPVGARFSAPVQTGPGAHPAPCTMGTGSFPGVNCGRGVTLTPHPLLMPWS